MSDLQDIKPQGYVAVRPTPDQLKSLFGKIRKRQVTRSVNSVSIKIGATVKDRPVHAVDIGAKKTKSANTGVVKSIKKAKAPSKASAASSAGGSSGKNSKIDKRVANASV